MSARVLSFSVSTGSSRRVWCDLLVGPLAILFVLLFSLFVPVRANAQVNMTLGQLIPDLIRNTSQTVSASAAGLQVAEGGSVGIRAGSSLIGSVAINELRSIPLATIAGRVVTSTLPGVLAALAIDLAVKGIIQCATSSTGWCGPSVSTNSSDTGFNGNVWSVSYNGKAYPGNSPWDACAAGLVAINTALKSNYAMTSVTYVTATQYNCNAGSQMTNFASAFSSGTCITGYVASGSNCVVDPNAPAVSYTYPQLSSNLAQVLSGNPDRAKDYWGFEPWTEQASWLADPSTQALPSQIVSPADGKVTGLATSTQTSAGTTTQQTSCTVSPNSDSSTLAAKPVSVACTTTTTNPDGSTTTSTTTTTPTTQDGSNPSSPASSPVACGLGKNGSPKCLIDETGTPTDGATAMSKSATDLQTAEQTAEAQLSGVNNNRSWTLTMPHILPGGTCEPIEWFSWGSWRGSWDVCTQLQYVRDLLAWLWPVLSAVYVWNKAAGSNAGVV